VKAFPKFGQGSARFWFVGAGKAPFKSNTVYLKDGHFATQAGSISAKYDVEASQYLRLKSIKGYGEGETQLWYAKSRRNGFGPDTMYLKTGNLMASGGSIFAAKSLIAGRSVQIRAWPGYGSGSAHLWFAKAGNAEFKPNTLYLKDGNIRTQVGSIVSAKDLEAGRFLKVQSMPGHGTGEAQLFYSHTSKGTFAAKTLYLKSGDFRTQKGSIYAGNSLHASKYVEIRAFPGFGSGSVKLWHCNSNREGYFANTLYVENGDFRTQKGSIYAAKDIVTNRFLTIRAQQGYGTGHTKLWYSATGKGKYRSKSLYLTSGDFRTVAGSIHASANLHTSKYLKIAAWPGHGRGYAKLWHSKTGHKGFGANTLYLSSGHFQVQKGSLIASQDIQVGRYVKIGALAGYGTGFTQLWYSGTGKGKIAPSSLYLQSGDFRTEKGNIVSAKDVVAKGTLYGAKLDVEFATVPGQITTGHLYLGNTVKQKKPESASTAAAKGSPVEMETTELIDVESNIGEERMEVGQALRDLADSNTKISTRNAAMRDELQGLLSRLATLETTLAR